MSDRIHELLARLVADHDVLSRKFRSFHWTVRGAAFFRLHDVFEGLYEETAATADQLAERLVALGGTPPLGLREALEQAHVEEMSSSLDARGMVAAAVEDLRAVNESLRAAARAAEQQGDVATMNLLDGKADEREKTLWMLRAFLAE